MIRLAAMRWPTTVCGSRAQTLKPIVSHAGGPGAAYSFRAARGFGAPATSSADGSALRRPARADASTPA
jgi:hypothetical protein